MVDALETILGTEVKSLFSATIQRLKSDWERQLEKYSLEGRKYLYFWADGICLNVRLTDFKPCVPVILGAVDDGSKEIVAIHDGQR